MTTIALSLLLKAEGAPAAKAAVQDVAKATDQLASATSRTTTADKAAATAMQASARAAGQVATANKGAAGATGNLVANLNDISMMLMAGQNPLQLAIQQGTQITQVIGPMGAAGAAQALGGAFLSMLNPLNLVTLGMIAAAGAAVQWLTATADGAQTAEDRIKALTDATEAYRTAAEAAGAPVDALVEKYGSLAMVAAVALKNDAEREKAENMAALSAQVDGLANSFGGLWQQEVNIGGMVGTIIPAFQELKVQFNFTERAASQFLGLLRELETAEGPRATAEAARDLREWMVQAYGPVEKMPAKMQELYNELNGSTIKAAELQGTLDLVEGTARKVDAVAAQINRTIASVDGSRLSAAFSAAFPLASQLLSMAQGIATTLGQAAAFESAQRGEVAAQYALYGQGRVIGERLARESGSLYGGKSVLPQIPTNSGGGGGGGAAARDEADALQELIESLEGEIEALRVQDPIQQEMLKHREALAGATEAERRQVEELIATREREAAALEGAKARAEFFEDLGNNALEALIVKGESFNDVLKNIAQSLIQAALQATLFGEGPFGSLFGGKSIFSLLMPAAAGKATGGMIHGPGSGTSDSILTRLSNGEFVVNAKATARNRHLLEAINAGGLPGYAQGGAVGQDNRRLAARGTRELPAQIYMDLRGAEGDRAIEEKVRKGAAQMISLYDREGLPVSIQRVSGDAKRRG